MAFLIRSIMNIWILVRTHTNMHTYCTLCKLSEVITLIQADLAREWECEIQLFKKKTKKTNPIIK